MIIVASIISFMIGLLSGLLIGRKNPNVAETVNNEVDKAIKK